MGSSIIKVASPTSRAASARGVTVRTDAFVLKAEDGPGPGQDVGPGETWAGPSTLRRLRTTRACCQLRLTMGRVCAQARQEPERPAFTDAALALAGAAGRRGWAVHGSVRILHTTAAASTQPTNGACFGLVARLRPGRGIGPGDPQLEDPQVPRAGCSGPPGIRVASRVLSALPLSLLAPPAG